MNIHVRSISELNVLAQRLASIVVAGDILIFDGELGAGKTTFISALVTAMGSPSDVSSPTFVLAQHYDGPLPIYHLDIYRLDNDIALQSIDLDRYFSDPEAVTLVEWGVRLGRFMPESVLRISIDFSDSDDVRLFAFHSDDALWQRRIFGLDDPLD